MTQPVDPGKTTFGAKPEITYFPKYPLFADSLFWGHFGSLSEALFWGNTHPMEILSIKGGVIEGVWVP